MNGESPLNQRRYRLHHSQRSVTFEFSVDTLRPESPVGVMMWSIREGMISWRWKPADAAADIVLPERWWDEDITFTSSWEKQLIRIAARDLWNDLVAQGFVQQPASIPT